LGFSVKVIDPVPLKLEDAELAGNLKTRKLGEEVVKLFEKARPLIEPKAVYTSIRVSRLEDDLVYSENGQTLRGVILADMLSGGQEIIPYVVTIGPKLENEISEEKSLLHSYLLDKIGDYALHKALVYLKSLAAERFEDSGGAVSEFSPGTGTGELFGIEQQKPLFQILDGATESVGVHLTPSLMMIPRKSVSGVLAATVGEYVACAYCPRQCESRSTPFVGEYQRTKVMSGLVPRRRFTVAK
jgi:hypothetical protein